MCSPQCHRWLLKSLSWPTGVGFSGSRALLEWRRLTQRHGLYSRWITIAMDTLVFFFLLLVTWSFMRDAIIRRTDIVWWLHLAWNFKLRATKKKNQCVVCYCDKLQPCCWALSVERLPLLPCTRWITINTQGIVIAHSKGALFVEGTLQVVQGQCACLSLGWMACETLF